MSSPVLGTASLAHMCCFPAFLLSFPMPSAMPILGLCGWEGGICPCASACHIRSVLLVCLKSPPLLIVSLGGSWRVARDNHSLIFYLFLLNKASCRLWEGFSCSCKQGMRAMMGTEPWCCRHVPEHPSHRGHGGSNAGTVPPSPAGAWAGPASMNGIWQSSRHKISGDVWCWAKNSGK